MRYLVFTFLISALVIGCQTSNEEQERAPVPEPEIDEQAYLEKGRELANATQAVLAANLVATIKEKGTVGAIDFCQAKAIHLTDSMSMDLGAALKRVSDKNRNPSNTAGKNELAYINRAKETLKNGGMAEPQVITDGEKVTAYYPILTHTLCLQCHGTANEQVLPETLAALKEHYPNDLATGYAENEIRGIWVVEMER